MDMAPTLVPEVPAGQPRPSPSLRNPLPLSATQEQEVRKLYYARVRARCADEIKGEHATPLLSTSVVNVMIRLQPNHIDQL